MPALQFIRYRRVGNGIDGIGIPLYFGHCKIHLITMNNLTRTNFVTCSITAVQEPNDYNGIAIFHREESHTLGVGVIWIGEIELSAGQQILSRFEDTAAGAVPQNGDVCEVTVGYEQL